MIGDSGYTIKHRDEFEQTGRWSLARRSLDLDCFGMNLVAVEPGYAIPEHDELDRGQVEVFVILCGDAVAVLDGQDHPAPAGTFVRVAPQVRRTIRNDGSELVDLLIVSAPTTSGYEPMGWA